MIHMSLRLDIRPHGRPGIVLWFPVSLLWLVLVTLMAAALPFLLIGAIATLRRDVDGRAKDRVFISMD